MRTEPVRKKASLDRRTKANNNQPSDKSGVGGAPSLIFVGNRLASTLDLVGSDGKTLRQKYVIGEPHACPAGSADEMKRRGYVGAYTKQTEPLYRLPGSERIIRKRW